MEIKQNVSLKEFNTFGLDVNARYLAILDHEKHLATSVTAAKQNALPLLVLGGGSNILFAQDYPGLILKNEIPGKELLKEDSDHVWVRLGAGENWHQVVLWTLENGWGGIENLSLIPGTVGAAPMQNIGAYGVEISSVFSKLEAIHLETGALREFTTMGCQFGYRSSVFKGNLSGQFIITRVILKLSKKPTFNISYGAISQTLGEMNVQELSINQISKAVIRIRQSKLPDPGRIGNAGSFFKNPVISKDLLHTLKTEYANIPSYPTEGGLMKVPAGWLIEQCNWKGYRKGDIGVHDKQALVLVNYGNGQGNDLVELAHDISNSVHTKFGIQLIPEVNVI